VIRALSKLTLHPLLAWRPQGPTRWHVVTSPQGVALPHTRRLENPRLNIDYRGRNRNQFAVIVARTLPS
jgi:hypothetical protein